MKFVGIHTKIYIDSLTYDLNFCCVYEVKNIPLFASTAFVKLYEVPIRFMTKFEKKRGKPRSLVRKFCRIFQWNLEKSNHHWWDGYGTL